MSITERTIAVMGRPLVICLEWRATPGEASAYKWFAWVKERPGIWEASISQGAAITQLQQSIPLLWEEAPVQEAAGAVM